MPGFRSETFSTPAANVAVTLSGGGGRPVGLDTIAASTGEDATTIEDVYEPYLLQLGFLARTPRGRVVLPAGYAHMGYSQDTQQLKLEV